MKSKLEYWERRYRRTNNITSASVIGEPELVNERAKQKFADIVISVFDDLCLDVKTASVLAAGCGNGAVSEVLASRSKSLYGFDFSREAIQELRTQDTIGEYVVAAVSDIPFQRQFDVVTAFSILYHVISDDKWRSAIEELANATLNGGYLLIRINWSDEPLGEQSPDSHFYDRTRQAYQSEFERNSLTLVDVVDLPVKPMIFDELSIIPGGHVLKSLMAPVIVAADLFKNHENRLVVLKKEK